MQQDDSIFLQRPDVAELQRDTLQHNGALTPRQILSWLPKDATPEQQDSAIQAHIKPAEIRWSNNPDTLHLPVLGIGKSIKDANLPRYYHQSFFSDNSFFHPELPGGRLGVTGDPVPYTIAGDNFITSLLLGCFVLAMIAFANSWRFISRQIKDFFYAPRDNTGTITETSGELRFQLFLALQTCLLASILYLFYIRAKISDTFTLEYYQIIGIYTAIFAAYFLLKTVGYMFCGWVFFDKAKSSHWIQSFSFLISTEGVLLFPVVMLKSYLGLSTGSMIICIIIIVSILKLLALYRAYLIFLYRKGGFLQIFLYFCALELMPLLVLEGVLAFTSSYLEINF